MARNSDLNFRPPRFLLPALRDLLFLPVFELLSEVFDPTHECTTESAKHLNEVTGVDLRIESHPIMAPKPVAFPIKLRQND
jgi:hypothetical protein